MAIALLNKEKYLRAKRVAGDNDEKLAEEYKRIGGFYVEGPNKVIKDHVKIYGVYDKGAKKGAKKQTKKQTKKKAKKAKK